MTDTLFKFPDNPVHPVHFDGSRNGLRLHTTPLVDGQADHTANAAYREGLCRDCHQRPYSPGRTRCNDCHRIWQTIMMGYDR